MKRLMTVWLALLTGFVLTGCSAAAPATTSAGAGGSGAATPASGTTAAGPATKLTLGLGYIPDIQFAPFYMAKERGFYAAEGLDVDFRQGFQTDVLLLVGRGELRFGVASGDEVLVARSQGVPLVYVATWYQKFPISVIALEKNNIRRVEDLRGRTVGVPQRAGATYVGLRALLTSAGMSENDVQIREVGFTQVQALTQGQVDAVVGYTNNEPVQLRGLGEAITTIDVFDRVNLVSNGLVTNEQTLRERPDLVEKMTRATLRGLEEVIARPDEAVDTVIAGYIPEAAPKRATLRQVLDASIPLMQSDLTARQGLGAIDPAAWNESRDLLGRLRLLGGEVDLDKAYTTRFLPRRP